MVSGGLAVEPDARRTNDWALALVGLPELMARTAGALTVPIGFLDGPVAIDHPDLAGADIRAVNGRVGAACISPFTAACGHGTFVAGILSARRGSRAPAICPDAPLLVRPIFTSAGDGHAATATPAEVAQGIVDAVTAGARVLNLSAATQAPTTRVEHQLHQSLDFAASRGVLVVAAAGNRAALGSSAITRHPWVIPVVAFDARGRPLDASTLGSSIGRNGLGAPGEAIESLGPDAAPHVGGGSSAAAAFVTGAIALLWSLVADASAHRVRSALLSGRARRGGHAAAA